MAVDIKPVRTRVGRHRFVDFPFRLFKHDPTWVPPLRMSVLDRISPKYPANDHQDTALWMAYRNGKPVGRIGACVDHNTRPVEVTSSTQSPLISVTRNRPGPSGNIPFGLPNPCGGRCAHMPCLPRDHVR